MPPSSPITSRATSIRKRSTREELREKLWEALKQSYENKEQEIGSEVMRHIEKVFMLQAVDHQWKDHLLAMDHLKEGIGLRGYGQKDPLIEYKKEGFDMFEEMKLRIVESTVENLFRIRAAAKEQSREIERKQKRQVANLTFVGAGTMPQQPRPSRCMRARRSAGTIPVPAGAG